MSLTIGNWLSAAKGRLAGSDNPSLDAELLLRHILGVNRAYLYTWPDRVLTEDQDVALERLLVRRAEGLPVAYLTGVREFWSLPLEVAPSTLIPRGDTETLIEWALALELPAAARMLDLGTGTGAIALALKSEYPAATVEAVEFSPEAASLARRNSERLELPITVHQGSWFEPVSGRFDLIASNPPYIDPEDHHLSEGDVRFEPRSALIADDAGLADLAHIIARAPEHLQTGGWLLLEHGYDQAGQVCDLLRQRGFVEVENRPDLAGNPRISGGRWPGDDA